jgi:hypothetical protein
MQEGGLIKLRWGVDPRGYDLVEREKRGSTIIAEQPAGVYLVPRSSSLRVYEAGLREHDIFLQLANADPTPEGALAFVAKWGLPDRFGERSPETLLEEFQAIRESFAWSMTASAMAVRRALQEHNFGSLQILWAKNRLVLRPFTLIQFCWLERQQALDGGADVARCLECGTFLPMNFKKGRPKDYCSDACKQRHWRKRQRINH